MLGNLTLLSMCIFNPRLLTILSLHKPSKTGAGVIEQIKHFDPGEKMITSLIIRGQNDRVYYGIGTVMYCVIKLN